MDSFCCAWLFVRIVLVLETHACPIAVYLRRIIRLEIRNWIKDQGSDCKLTNANGGSGGEIVREWVGKGEGRGGGGGGMSEINDIVCWVCGCGPGCEWMDERGAVLRRREVLMRTGERRDWKDGAIGRGVQHRRWLWRVGRDGVRV